MLDHWDEVIRLAGLQECEGPRAWVVAEPHDEVVLRLPLRVSSEEVTEYGAHGVAWEVSAEIAETLGENRSLPLGCAPELLYQLVGGLSHSTSAPLADTTIRFRGRGRNSVGAHQLSAG